MKYKILLVSLFSMSINSASFAASIDFDDNGTFTTDNLSGLDWLDVTASVNQSYDYVSSQFGSGGEYAGWRYATGSEFNELVSNFTGSVPAIDTGDRVYFAAGELAPLIALIGDTFDAYAGTSITRDYTYGITADLRPSVSGYVASILWDEPSAINPTYSQQLFSGVVPTEHQPWIGSYLVRDTILETPIPAALVMFAPALLGFLGLRRKAKNTIA